MSKIFNFIGDLKENGNKVALDKDVQDILKSIAKITPVFVGTTDEYNTAYDKGEIAVGTIVMITDDDGTPVNSTTSILGEAILGYMILG